MRLCSAARRASRSGISVTIHTKANPFSMYASCRHLLQGCRHHAYYAFVTIA